MTNLSEKDNGVAKPLLTALEVASPKPAQAVPWPATQQILDRARSEKSRLFDGPNYLVNEAGKMVRSKDQILIVQAIINDVWASYEVMNMASGEFEQQAPNPSDEDLLELQIIQSEDEADFALMEKVSVSKIDGHMFALRDKRKPGEMVPLREAVVKTFESDRRAIETSLVKRTHTRTVPIVRRVLEQFQITCFTFLSGREVAERQEAELFGLEYAPSRTWLAAAHVLMTYEPSKRLPASHAHASPKNLLAGIVDL